MFRSTVLKSIALIAPVYFPIAKCNSITNTRDNQGKNIFSPLIKEETFTNFQNKTKINIFRTPAHITLIGILHDYCTALIKDQFVGKNGVHSRLLQGSKGIGKSTVLEAFVEYCPQEFKDIIPIYITFNDLTRKRSLVSRKDIIEIIILKLIELKIVSKDDFKEEADYLAENIIEILKKNNKYILLLIDELDQIYRVKGPLAELGLENLGNLTFLGDQKSGRFVVFLCGSSASCPLLVTCHANPNEFPLQVGAPNLNGTKYKTERIPTSPFTDINLIKVFSDEICINNALARLIAFCCGNNPRAVSIMISDLQHESSTKDLYNMGIYGNHESGLKLLASKDEQILFNKILEKLFDKNILLFESLHEGEELSIKKIMNHPWEEKFIPLNQSEIIAIWDNICHENKEPVNLEKLQYLLFSLSDKDQITFHEITNGLPKLIFPMRLSQIFIEYHKPSWLPSFINNFNFIMRSEIEKIKTIAYEQGVSKVAFKSK